MVAGVRIIDKNGGETCKTYQNQVAASAEEF